MKEVRVKTIGMPFVKVAGKWISSADGVVGDIGPQRLVIIDKQVDENGGYKTITMLLGRGNSCRWCGSSDLNMLTSTFI